jgi:hypothetical protein
MKPLIKFVILAIILAWLGGIAFAMRQLFFAQSQLADITERQRYMGCFESGYPTTEEIERHGWMKFPPSASNPVPYSEDFCNTFYLRFEISRTDLNKFVESTQIRFPLSATHRPMDFQYLPDNLDWKLHNITSFWSGEAIFPEVYQQSILIDRNDMQRYIVYLIMRDLAR